MTTLRVLLHVAAQRDYKLHSLEFSTTFLQGSLHEEMWLRPPPGFTGSFPAGTQWSLRRPVYGLRQAPREWHDTLRTTLAALRFAPFIADTSLFLRTDTTLPPFYVLVYVDDLVFATADTEALAHVKPELQKRHTCTDLGELISYLGLQITQDRAQCTITLTQSHMVQQVLQRFGFTYSLPQSTPLPTGHSLSAPPLDDSVEPSGPYPELVTSTCTRPGLAYPLILVRYVARGRHRKEHMDAAKRVLRYLCSTSGMGLVLGGRARVVLTGHADASGRSTRSSSVLSSSCEAEIYAGAMAAQELRWLTYLLTDLGESPCSPPVLYVDNKAMIALCEEHRLEHIALRYFLARELQQPGQLRLAHVATRAKTVDVFTKALQPCDHQRFCTVLGVVFSVLLVLLYITLHVNWPCGHLLVLEMRGDIVIHPELALPFLTGLMISCVPTCTHLLASSVISFLHYSEKLLQRYCYWPEMLTDVKRHVASCPTCQIMKSSRKRPAGHLQLIPPPERAWQQVTMDFVTGLLAGASCSGVAHKGYNPIRRCPTICAALPCPSRHPAGRALPCPARHAALGAERRPALPIAPPDQPRAALHDWD
ncbi:unnamed protein product [Closterium sp. NIES-54]